MIFFSSIIIMMFYNAYFIYQRLVKKLKPSELSDNKRKNPNLSNIFIGILGSIHFPALAFGCSAVLIGVTFVGPVRGDSFNWCVPLFFLFGLLSFALSIAQLRGLYRKNKAEGNFFKVGACVLVIFAGTYIAYTTIDHWVFTRKAGFANLEAMGAESFCRDLGTNAGVAFVQMDDDTAVYRCPTLIMLGQVYPKPFIPWPYYREGESADLKSVIDDMIQEAQKATEAMQQKLDESP